MASQQFKKAIFHILSKFLPIFTYKLHRKAKFYVRFLRFD